MDPGKTSVLFRAIPSQLKLTVEAKRSLTQFARLLSEKVGGNRPFTCLISNDNDLRRLNRQFLGHNYATDVLSFPSEADGLGEIAISIERAQEQALEFGHSCIDEMKILMLHGVLHLSGLDHEKDAGEMERAEEYWQVELKLPLTLVARATAAANQSGGAA